MSSLLFKAATCFIEDQFKVCDVLVKGQRIAKIAPHIQETHATEIRLSEHEVLLPGLIDDQVHFREPGLTQKGTIYTESRAAVAGGITSYMEMPNTKPPAVSLEELEKKYSTAARDSVANYSFYIGTTNSNVEVLQKADFSKVCGTKIFMGSSTGNMLVDNEATLEAIFAQVDSVIATHCESTPMIREQEALYRKKYGEEVPIQFHPDIRSREACYASSSMAVRLAKKHQARLHVLHISTAEELALFEKGPIDQKLITAEACVHHLWFERADYATKGTLIKWNPAVKEASDRAAIQQAVVDRRIDILATDHAPHLLSEKQQSYFKAPSGGPLVQHALAALHDLIVAGTFTWKDVIELNCYNPTKRFRIEDRGYIREGYFADLVVFDTTAPLNGGHNLLSKCQWSPFDGHTFKGSVSRTIVNGKSVFSRDKGLLTNDTGSRLSFKSQPLS